MKPLKGIASLSLSAVALAVAGLAMALIRPAHATTVRTSCGVERWAVKTLSDSVASRVDFWPRPTTVTGLRRRRPGSVYIGERSRPVELSTYRVRARLVGMKLEDDMDIHMVIADPRFPARTMTLSFRSRAASTAPRQRENGRWRALELRLSVLAVPLVARLSRSRAQRS